MGNNFGGSFASSFEKSFVPAADRAAERTTKLIEKSLEYKKDLENQKFVSNALIESGIIPEESREKFENVPIKEQVSISKAIISKSKGEKTSGVDLIGLALAKSVFGDQLDSIITQNKSKIDSVLSQQDLQQSPKLEDVVSPKILPKSITAGGITADIIPTEEEAKAKGTAAGIEESEKLKQQKDIKSQIAAEQATTTQKAKAGILLNPLTRNLKLYSDSKKELKEKYPDIGKTGTEGIFASAQAMGGLALRELPKTRAMILRKDMLGQQIAVSLEGKATDRDALIQVKGLTDSILNPDETNIILGGQSLLNLYDMGYGIDKILQSFVDSEDEDLKNIAKYTMKEMGFTKPDNKKE